MASDALKPSKKRNLLEDSASDSEDGGAELSAPKLNINEDYARRFEHNKKREERQRLEEKYKSSKKPNKNDKDGGDDIESTSESSSDSETEDEDGFLATEDLDAQISTVLSAIKNKDPRVRDKNFSFFQASNDAAPGDAETPAHKKEKPMFLKDYHREKILAGDIGASDDEDDNGPPKPRTYAQEQDDLKKSIVSEINKAAAQEGGEDEDEDGFVKRKKTVTTKPETDANGIHPSRSKAIQHVSEADVAGAEKDPETFLSNFMSSRAWAAEGGGRNWEAFESDDDDEALERAEEFEQAYNMRFEDPNKSNEVLRSYARDITEAKSVRRDDLTGRQRKRQQEREQKEAEKAERREEKARLRRLRVEEAQEKLDKIKKVAGLSGKKLKDEEWAKFLDADWDDANWEKEMQKQFGEDYYAENEPDDEEGSGDEEEEGGGGGSKKKSKKPKKPTWDDDIDITDIVPDFKDETEKPNFSLSDIEDEEDNHAQNGEEDEEQDDDDDEDRPSKKRKTEKDHRKDRQAAKKSARDERAKLEALVDARMDLDVPPTASDLPTNKKNKKRDASAAQEGVTFRYRETSPQAFGMSAKDILLAPNDASLNKFAGLKKFATYRDPEKKRKDRKRLGKKARLREWRRETFGRQFERTGPVWDAAVAEAEKKAAKAAKAKEETGNAVAVGGGGGGGGGAEDGAAEQKKKRKRSRGKKSKGETAADDE